MKNVKLKSNQVMESLVKIKLSNSEQFHKRVLY